MEVPQARSTTLNPCVTYKTYALYKGQEYFDDTRSVLVAEGLAGQTPSFDGLERKESDSLN